jgi:hypothetical protein
MLRAFSILVEWLEMLAVLFEIANRRASLSAGNDGLVAASSARVIAMKAVGGFRTGAGVR